MNHPERSCVGKQTQDRRLSGSPDQATATPIRISPVKALPARNTPAPDDTAAVDTHRNYAVAPILGGVELLSAVYRNHRFAPHSQDAAVIGVVEQGRAVVFGGGETLTLEKGSVLVIPPHVLHDAYSLGDGEWHYRALYLNRSQIAELTPDARVGQGVLGTRPIVLQTADVTNRSSCRCRRRCRRPRRWRRPPRRARRAR